MRYLRPNTSLLYAVSRDKRLGESVARRINNLNQRVVLQIEVDRMEAQRPTRRAV